MDELTSAGLLPKRPDCFLTTHLRSLILRPIGPCLSQNRRITQALEISQTADCDQNRLVQQIFCVREGRLHGLAPHSCHEQC